MRRNLPTIGAMFCALALSTATSLSAQSADASPAPTETESATAKASAPKTKIVVKGIGRKGDSAEDSPDAVKPIQKAEIEEAVAEDLGDVIRSQPGVYLQRTAAGQASPIVRGMTGKQLLLLVDKVRFSNPTFRSGPNQYFASLDPYFTESIEIVRGPYSVLYGSDALGGVINVTSRSPRFYGVNGGFHPGLRGQYSSANRGEKYTLDLPFSLANERFAAYATLSRGEYENIQGGRSVPEQPFTAYSEWGGTGAFTYRMSDFWTLDGRFAINQKDDVNRTDALTTYVAAPSKIPPTGPKELKRVFTAQDDLFSSVKLGYAGSGRVESASLTIFTHRVHEALNRITRNAPNTLRDQFFTDTTIGARGELILDYGDASRLTLGADFAYDSIDSGYQRVDLTTGVRTERDDKQFPDGASYMAMGVFAQDEIWFADGALEFRPGIRLSGFAADAEVSKFDPSLDDVDAFFSDATASLALAWHAAEWLTPSVQLARGFRAPNLTDLASGLSGGAGDEIPNPHLDPEQMLAAQLGLRAYLDNKDANSPAPFRLNASAFYFEHWLTDAHQREPVMFNGNAVFQTQNVGRARIRGSEFAAEYYFGSELSGLGINPNAILSEGDALGVWGTLTYTRGDVLTTKTLYDRIPPVMAGFGLNYLFAGGKGYIKPSAEIFGSQDRIGRPTDVRFPVGQSAGFTLYHLAMGWTPSEHLKIGLRINNITNKDYHILGSGVLGTGTDFRLFTEIRW